MTEINEQMVKSTAFEKPYSSAIGKESPAENPKNCRNLVGHTDQVFRTVS